MVATRLSSWTCTPRLTHRRCFPSGSTSLETCFEVIWLELAEAELVIHTMPLRAEADHTTTSEVIREALRRFD